MYRIFLAEDDEMLCSLITKHLESWGYQVTAAEDFRDIMGEFVRSEAHLVLLDLKLPYFNGFHWCEEIRRVSQVPVIFLSSAADDMNMVMASSAYSILVPTIILIKEKATLLCLDGVARLPFLVFVGYLVICFLWQNEKSILRRGSCVIYRRLWLRYREVFYLLLLRAVRLRRLIRKKLCRPCRIC